MSDQPTATLLHAAWVAPMDATPFRDGAVLFQRDRITAVGPTAELRRAAPRAAVHDCGDAVILPGLVNAHTHLELSHLTPPAYYGRFTDWLVAVVRTAGDELAAANAVGQGVAQCLRYGVTTVGDITRRSKMTRAALRSGPLRVVSFGEVVGMAARRAVMPELLHAAVTGPSTERLGTGVSPHAPYSIDADGYRRCLAAALENRLPLTTHLAESADEAVFLSDHAGPFRELWERLGAWQEGAAPRFEGGPVRYAQSMGLLEYQPVTLAHVNYCDDAELAVLAAGRASVAYCPRTHAYFRHPPHRWRDMLASGINVAAGTDSCASSPNLDLVEDLRLIHRIAPGVPAHTLWEMATVRGARALGVNTSVGSLAPGKFADLAVFPASERPLQDILESATVPREVWVAGVRV